MLPLLEPFNLRWLEEPVIPDDLHGYAELHGDEPRSRSPAASTSSRSTASAICSRRARVDYIQFDTNRVGGITQARKICRARRGLRCRVVPHAGQMHNYHVVMASLNSPMAEYFPPVDVEVGNELSWYIFDGEPMAENGRVRLNERPGLGIEVQPRDPVREVSLR